MIKALEEAIKKIRALPPERQADAADALERIACAAQSVHVLSEEEGRLVDEGLADLDAGRMVPDDEMERFWSRYHK